MPDPKPTVVVLHGLGRTRRSLVGLRRHIERAGFPTWSETYSSRRLPIPALAAEVAARIRAEVPGDVLAVTHSLGGILVRHMAALLPWKGVVMLAPPNGGSRVAARLHTLGSYRWFYGPAGQELIDTTSCPAPPAPFAVIAGTAGRSLSNPISWITRAAGIVPADLPSDGTVTVEETRLPGMADFATVDASHTWIMNHPTVREWVVHFLNHGRFHP